MIQNLMRTGGTRRLIKAVLIVVLTALIPLSVFSGCGGSGVQENQAGWVQTVIYMGRDIPGGGVVSEADFQKFLEEVVTEEFPKGLTVFDAYGQMQKEDKTIERQSTKVILLVHQEDGTASEAVQRVIDAYRERFGSPQVMHTTSPIEVEFFPAGDGAVKPTKEEVVA